MKKFTKVMKALSDPSRVRILKMLQRKQMCVCEIQKALGIAQSTASKHLKILEEAGLTTYKKDGLWVNYTLADGSDSPYAATMLGNIRHWLENEEEIAELSRQIFDIRREDICRAKDRQNQRNNH
ncbi:ArsR family transcriptional regulator [Desulfosalsimonas propionicica]|uniref:ArsR family transcriptional regulator n=1 Tax=Desulfosalsimonas propionicica TaxID=332175 RepID=A0A7W0C859_9BACT|nr:metalloregulator ArsR/SmtB family transcription factor [Desulfosalsimonas propionicica]MBA2880928.1 ArsR family transcriptional regulator [Desulfosalsimonas propionicica]